MSKPESMHLRTLLAGYFHQEFTCYGSPDDTLMMYIADCTAEQISASLERIRELRNESLTEPNHERLLLEWGCAYDPTADGWTYTSWLEHVESILARYGDHRTEEQDR